MDMQYVWERVEKHADTIDQYACLWDLKGEIAELRERVDWLENNARVAMECRHILARRATEADTHRAAIESRLTIYETWQLGHIEDHVDSGKIGWQEPLVPVPTVQPEQACETCEHFREDGRTAPWCGYVGYHPSPAHMDCEWKPKPEQPNAETLEAFAATERGEGITEHDDVNSMLLDLAENTIDRLCDEKPDEPLGRCRVHEGLHQMTDECDDWGVDEDEGPEQDAADIASAEATKKEYAEHLERFEKVQDRDEVIAELVDELSDDFAENYQDGFTWENITEVERQHVMRRPRFPHIFGTGPDATCKPEDWVETLGSGGDIIVKRYRDLCEWQTLIRWLARGDTTEVEE